MKSVSFIAAVRAQFWLALKARTVYFMLAMAALPWAAIVLITKLATNATNDETGRALITPDVLVGPFPAIYCVALGGMWGLLVWRDEPPKSRFYHWSLPVDMTTHEISRLSAYLVWLFVGMSAFIACGIVILMGYNGALHLGKAGPLPWVSAYGSGVIGFFITATISTAVNRALEYLAAIAIGGWSLALLATIYHFDTVKTILVNVFAMGTSYSLGSALMNGGIVGWEKYAGVDPYSIAQTVDRPVIGPLMLWVCLGLVSVIGASFVNRGRAS